MASDRQTFLQCVYFSVVTITTLGYGDITPKSDIGMVLASLQAVIGIVNIGLFLNSIWYRYSKRMEAAQEAALARRTSIQNLRRLSSYYQFLRAVILDYQVALAELTTPIADRKGNLKPNPLFKFSDMQDLYRQSVLTKSGFSKPVIHLYFDKLDALTKEFKFLLANFELYNYVQLQQLIIDFLTLSKAEDIREALFSYESIRAEQKFLKDSLEEAIRQHEECPDLEQNLSKVITPAILLYRTLKFQVTRIGLISQEFEKIITTKDPAVAAERGAQ